jgi:hypothetical protein
MDVERQALQSSSHHSTIRPFSPIYQTHNLGLWPEEFNDMSGYSWFCGSSMQMPCWTMSSNQEQ